MPLGYNVINIKFKSNSKEIKGCDILKKNFQNCMEEQEDNIEYCKNLRIDYENCLAKEKNKFFMK